MSSHTIKTPLNTFGDEVFANWSKSPGETAVFFIHGFRGNAIKTWVEFPAYITSDPRFRNCDFFFYGYDTLRQQIGYSAAAFYRFIDDIYKSNDTIYNESIGNALGQSRKKITYSNIVIVAHSMGAVVTRFAILNAIKEKAVWVQQAKMVLFAPAHRGALVHKLWVDSLPPLINAIANVINFTLVTISELDPKSDTLKDLLSKSEKYLNTTYEPCITAKEVVAASRDNIVKTLDFLNDPVPTPLQGNHTSVCKPRKGFEQPLNIVAKYI